MSAPSSSFEMNSLTDKITPVGADTLLLKDTQAANELKELSVTSLQTFILDTPTITSFTNATHDHSNLTGGGQLLSTSALSDTGDIAYLNTANSYIAGTRQDFLGLVAGTSGLNVGSITGNPITQLDGDIWYNSSLNTLFGRINGLDVDLGGAAVSNPFTWAASDEDSPLFTGINYITEVTEKQRTFSEVKITLKNAPTGGIVKVDIQKETAPNSNSFSSIFSTLPQIEINEFFNTNSVITPVFSTTTWEINTRLSIQVNTNDTNFAATGLKATLVVT